MRLIFLLLAGANTNLKDDKGRTALLRVASNSRTVNPRRDIEIFTRLVAFGADVNVRDQDGKSALYYSFINDLKSVSPNSLEATLERANVLLNLKARLTSEEIKGIYKYADDNGKRIEAVAG